MELKPGYKQTDVGVFPEDWEIKKLSEISPKQSVGLVINPSTYFDPSGTVPMLVGSNIRENKIDWDRARKITAENNSRLHASRIYADDLVTVRVGDPGVTAVVPAVHDGSNCASVMIIRRHSSFNSEWLCHLMNSTFGRDRIASIEYGTAQKQFNIGDAIHLLYPKPPLSEQSAIATALSDVDALVNAQDALIEKKRAIKQGTMQELLTGKRRLPGFTRVWETRRLGDCLRTKPTYGVNASATVYSDRLPTYIRITDISNDGKFVPLPRVSVDSLYSSNYILNEGDVVFARTGASVGKSYLYCADDGELVFAGFLIRVQPDSAVLHPAFLAAYAKTNAYWLWIKVMSMRSGQPGINGNEYGNLEIPVPAIEEQIAISEVLAAMDTQIAALEAKRKKTALLKQGMMQELLTGRIRFV